MKSIAIVGAGVSGLTVAHQLKDRYQVTIFEKEDRAGGLIRCKRVEGSLYHLCGGHVFNTKRNDVLDFFWSKFDKEKEYVKADRNSAVHFSDDQIIPYPVENHMYLFPQEILKRFIEDVVVIAQTQHIIPPPGNFEEFLKSRFGGTLYDYYFKPYNEKVWRCDLRDVPLDWLEGKLPMPTVQEMIYNNIHQVKEKSFVHSSFFYEKNNGSQFLADRLADGLNIKFNTPVTSLEYQAGKWLVNGATFDAVAFCGNIKDLPRILSGVSIDEYVDKINALKCHGTTSVFCEIAKNPYSWIYLPSTAYAAHRIICTGNFASSNNAGGKMTATIEFTDAITKEDILENLSKLPYSPVYLDHHYSRYTYPIQDNGTRQMVRNFKEHLAPLGFYLTGRFADWEYYNMDVAMGAAIDLCKKL